MILAFDNPVTSLVGGAAAAGGRAVFGSVVDGVVGALADACARVVQQLVLFLDRSSTVSFDTGWWAGTGGQQLFASVLRLSAALMVVFLLLAVAQGVLSGEPAQSLRAAAVEAPLSVLGTVCLVAVTTVLLGVTDGASSLVLGGATGDLGRFSAGFGTKAALLTNGLVAIVLAIVFLVGALLVWVELAVRASLIYFLVLVGPVALSARVWPSARGAFRKLVELGVAVIVSKFAIALALALGAAALGGGGPDRVGDGAAAQVGQDLSGLLVGATLMLLAAFSPFVVLRLVPIVEGAAIAHGISRSPLRGAMAGAQTVYYGQGLMRLAGGGAKDPGAALLGVGPAAGGPPGGGTPPSGGGGAAVAAAARPSGGPQRPVGTGSTQPGGDR